MRKLKFSIKKTIEESFLCDLIFDQKINPKLIDKINYNKLVKFGSSHLIIPLIYVKLHEKKILNLFPKDLTRYLKFIYDENLKRNKILLEEVKSISEIFNENNIDYAFIKGASLLLSNTFRDHGERMIGDIDILVNPKQIIFSKQLLNKNKYKNLKNQNSINFNEQKHLKRLVNKEGVFAIELHKKCFIRVKNNFDSNFSKNLLSTKISHKNIFISNNTHRLSNVVYNNQFNDKNNLYVKYNYRSLYDFYSVIKKNNFNINQIELDKYFKRYILFCKILSLEFTEKVKFKNFDLLNLYFIIILNNKYLSYLHNSICKFYIRSKFLPNQMIKIVNNRNYRKKLIKKLFLNN